jgi:DNA invertase Pin-like site-specific DNA recombinase
MGYTAGISTSRQHFSDKCAGGNYINGGLRETLQLLASDQADGLIVAKLDGPARSVVHAASIIEDAKVPRWSLVVLDPGVDLSAAFRELRASLVNRRSRVGDEDGRLSPGRSSRYGRCSAPYSPLR